MTADVTRQENIAALFAQWLGQPDKRLYRQHGKDGWRDITVGEVAERAARWQQIFRHFGLGAGSHVAICARSGVDWVAFDLAALAAGMVVVPLYVDDNIDNIAWCLNDCCARLAVFDNPRIERSAVGAMAIAGMELVRTICLGDDCDALAGLAPPAGNAFAVSAGGGNDLATICYTSGTAGRPKGVMLSHRNILANVSACEATGLAKRHDLFLSFLPLSHMFERTGGYYLPLMIGARVCFARSINQLADDLAGQRPTIIFAVPRVFEKFAGRIRKAMAESPHRQRLFDECVNSGWRAFRGQASITDRLFLPLLRRLVARPVLARLGGRLRLAVVGGAALDPEVARLFVGLGLTVLHGYGMTEAAPVVCVNRPDDNDPLSVGRPLPGVEVRIADNHELLVRGANVMLGYWRNPSATAAAIDADGWLHTGDQADIAQGRITIRGRIKDILVLSNGEKLPPQDVEMAIMGDEAFESAMLVGEGRPFLTLLAVSPITDEKELVKRANQRLKDMPRYIRVRRVIRCAEPWTVENGLLTPTLKLKRPRLIEANAQVIDETYRNSGLA